MRENLEIFNKKIVLNIFNKSREAVGEPGMGGGGNGREEIGEGESI